MSNWRVVDGNASGSGWPTRPALVASHERSGTHFLMNTLGHNFGYLPYTNVDARPGFDPRCKAQMLDFLFATPWPRRTVLKSHHQVEMLPELARLAEVFEVFYIVRDPRDALLSFWRFLGASEEGTGPRPALVGEFLRTPTAGLIERYQRQPLPSMIERWRVHVEGWTSAIARLPGRVTLVRYDDLDERFAATVGSLAAALGRPAPLPVPRRPSAVEHVVQPGDGGGSGRHRATLADADQQLVREAAGDLLRRLGFSPD